MQNIDCLMDNVAQSIWQSLDNGNLRYRDEKLPLGESTATQCNFSFVGSQATNTYRFIAGFYGLTDVAVEFQKPIDKTLIGFKYTYSFLDDIIIVFGGGVQNHQKKVIKCLERLDEENPYYGCTRKTRVCTEQ